MSLIGATVISIGRSAFKIAYELALIPLLNWFIDWAKGLLK
jgi:hypothetical protein